MEQTNGKDTRIVDVTDWERDCEGSAARLGAAAQCLHDGGLVAFPTETVYGLGADALNRDAAAQIYAAKGRPSDNPLIVHIADVGALDVLGYPNALAHMLAQAFWPGPLTLIVRKRECVPHETTGGLDTVAVRMPSHPVALELIRQSGVYVAAPSANISGRPSPTTAAHVREDLYGKIAYIVDGGPVGIGIESTIVDTSGDETVILRPGYITKQMLEQIVGSVSVDPALEHPTELLRPKAPGMKYTHYAPKGELSLVETDLEGGEDGQRKVIEAICALADEKRRLGYRVGIMAPQETLQAYEGHADTIVCVGCRQERDTVAAGLYAALRQFDADGAQFIYAESFRGEGLSYAIMNRLLKAAGQRVIHI